MKLIERYLFRQLLWPTLGTVTALCAVAMLGQGLSTFDVIVEQRQSAFVFVRLVLLALPQVAAMILPICLFVGALVAYNRLHTEQEIVVCFAGGMSRWRVVSPALRLTALAVLATLVVNLFVQPVAYRAMRDTLFAVRTDLVAGLIREGEFTHPAEGLTVYAQSSAAGRLRNVHISVERPDGSDINYSAAEGRIGEEDGKPVVVLRYGSTNELNRQGVLNVLAFDEYAFELAPYLESEERIHYKISDRFLHELLFPDLSKDWERQNHGKLLAEAHYRLSSPIYLFAFVLLALAAVIGGGFSRVGYTRRILAFGGVAAVVRIAGFGVQAACNDMPWVNVVQYLIPLAACWWPARILFRPRLSRPAPRIRDYGAPSGPALAVGAQ